MSNVEYKFIVDVAKVRVDKFLVEKVEPKLSRGTVQRLVERGFARVNGGVVSSASDVVRLGQEVLFTVPESVEELVPKNIPIKTLYNDNGILIIDKPPGLSVHPGAGFKGDSLAEALLFHFDDIKLVGEEGRPGIVHRLDKDTSGVMVVARTQEMYEYLKDAFSERKIKKEYIALVSGSLKEPHGVIEVPIGKSKMDFRKYTTKKSDMILAKDSKTEFWVLENLTHESESGVLDEYSLIKVQLHTGRTHQIRVHLSSLGFPLVGDELYGGKKAYKLGLSRQFLHSRRIEVQLPSGVWIEAESKLPDDLREVLINLDSNKVNQL
jgi:23S rRNA pseudouridine1911/1915/1917 synthase